MAVFADTEADMVAAFAITYAEEAIGIVRAARANALPVAISFTVETDGRLPSGEALADAILRADAETDGYAIESDTLDSGDPDALGQDYLALRSQLPALSILGGCCGTDHRPVEAVCRAVRVPA